MDLLFNKAQRQVTSLANDLGRFTEHQPSTAITPSQQGNTCHIYGYLS